MKARAFIGMFRALNNLGLFVNFSESPQRVTATLAPMAEYPTGVHGEFHVKHSGKSRDRGLSERTARAANKFFNAALQTSSESKGSGAGAGAGAGAGVGSIATANPRTDVRTRSGTGVRALTHSGVGTPKE
jgi:hypothetical protein